jgi:hypothetical protein
MVTIERDLWWNTDRVQIEMYRWSWHRNLGRPRTGFYGSIPHSIIKLGGHKPCMEYSSFLSAILQLRGPLQLPYSALCVYQRAKRRWLRFFDDFIGGNKINSSGVMIAEMSWGVRCNGVPSCYSICSVSVR